ncbi:UNVERIFIED_CONTAM: hypothetical protein H355_005617, partial [Colinus virginianus]
TRNGQVLMVLSMDNTCSATSFDMELCAEKLQTLGVQEILLFESSPWVPPTVLLLQLGWRHRLDQLRVVTEVAVPAAEETSCEESPLLPSGESFRKEPVMCNELLHLIPEGPPEVMRNTPHQWAEHLLGMLPPKLIPVGIAHGVEHLQT